jgi:hypothetical protein
VRPVASAPEGFIVHSHCGDNWQDCRDYVRQRLGLPAWQPGDERHQQRTIPPNHVDRWDFDVIDRECEDIHPRTEDDLARMAPAIRIWNEAQEPSGTAAEKYLASRALELPQELSNTVLRFHPRTPWRNENTGKTDFISCLIAAFYSIDDGALTAIHRIRVDQPKRWPKTERRMLGLVQRAAVKLGTAGNKLAIGEGAETCMAAMQLGITPAWALGSVGAISFFPLVEGVRELTILAEAGEASARHSQICGRRWKRAGRRVLISRPRVGNDHNDYLMRRIS